MNVTDRMLQSLYAATACSALAFTFAPLEGCGTPYHDRDAVAGLVGHVGTSTDASSRKRKLAEWNGHYDARTGRLSLTPTNHDARSLNIDGYAQLPSGYALAATTTASSIGRSQAFPSCLSTQLCADITIAETSSPSKPMRNIYLQLEPFSVGAVTVANSATVPSDYAFASGTTWGSFYYGDIINAQSSASREWIFNVGSTAASFSFHLSAWGVVERGSYTGNGTTSSGSFIDACGLTGNTSVLANATTPTASSGISVPFPFVYRDVISDTSYGSRLYVTSSGALGFNSVSVSDGTSTHVTLPDSSGNIDYTLFPFWSEALQTGPSGVCYGVSGTAPSRTFVATWKDATLAGTGADITFSVQLHEVSDRIDFVYSKWNESGSSCSTSTTSRGDDATIGIQGASDDTTSSVLFGFDGTPSTLPNNGSCDKEYSVSFTAPVQ